MVSNSPPLCGDHPSMGKHESIKDEPSGAAATAPAPAAEANVTPIMAMASNEPPNLEAAIETIKLETEKLAIAAADMPKIELASSEIPKMDSPRIAPDLSEAESYRDDAAGAADLPEPPAEAAPPPRISRFTMLAAALALAACLGGMIGALGAASLMHSGPAPLAANGKSA